MRFAKKKSYYCNKPPYYIGRKGAFYYTIKEMDGKFYTCIAHGELDINYNSKWDNTFFESVELATKWCIKAKPKTLNIKGVDVNDFINPPKTW